MKAKQRYTKSQTCIVWFLLVNFWEFLILEVRIKTISDLSKLVVLDIKVSHRRWCIAVNLVT